jgi:hypothetical protein
MYDCSTNSLGGALQMLENHTNRSVIALLLREGSDFIVLKSLKNETNIFIFSV